MLIASPLDPVSAARRRTWAVVRCCFSRDTASFARGWAGKLLVAAVLVAIPVEMVLT